MLQCFAWGNYFTDSFAADHKTKEWRWDFTRLLTFSPNSLLLAYCSGNLGFVASIKSYKDLLYQMKTAAVFTVVYINYGHRWHLFYLLSGTSEIQKTTQTINLCQPDLSGSVACEWLQSQSNLKRDYARSYKMCVKCNSVSLQECM